MFWTHTKNFATHYSVYSAIRLHNSVFVYNVLLENQPSSSSLSPIFSGLLHSNKQLTLSTKELTAKEISPQQILLHNSGFVYFVLLETGRGCLKSVLFFLCLFTVNFFKNSLISKCLHETTSNTKPRHLWQQISHEKCSI